VDARFNRIRARGERLSYKAHISHLENKCIELFIGHCLKDAAHNPSVNAGGLD
jgi:hypothetical protein